MLRGRFTRSQGRNRNPNNLHIIPIASVVNNKPVQLPPSFAVQQQVFPSVIPVLIPPASTSDFFDNNINYQGRYNKGRRKRKRKRDRKNFANKTVLNNADYQWINPTVIDQTNNNVVETSEKETEKVEAPEVPPPVEEDFEEVEVASSEGEGKKIPVGFRKTKLHYLNYKKHSFFKPKFYNFSSQRTVVNCLNIEDDVSVDVDVVSEAEYDECETDILDPDSTEKFGKIIEIEEESSNEITDEGEEETIQDVNDEMEEESNHIVTDEIEETANAVTIVDEESNDTVIDEGDKISTLAVANKLDKKSVQNVTNEVDQISAGTVINKVDEKSATCAVTNEVVGKSTCTLNVEEKDILPESNKAVPSTRVYKTCIESNDGLSQGKSLIQDKLDAWESHLIGLEYLLEIHDKNMVSVLKYYCVLCDEDLDFQELPELCVINHVNGRNHVTKYLEKHFSTSGYDLSKNSSYDFVVIQKLCEKINENLGYYFMCITNNDYYIENNLKIKGIIQNASHPSESDFKIDKITFKKNVDADLSENINNTIKDIIKKVIPKEEISTELENVDNNTLSERKLTDLGTKKKPAFTKSRPKYRGNNSISAFLRLRFAENTKLGTSSKESSNKSKKMQNKNVKLNEEQNVKDVKLHVKKIEESVKLPEQQQSTENTKLDNKQVVENVKSKSDEVLKSPISKNVVENMKSKSDQVPKSPTSKNVVENVNSKSDQVQKSPISKNVVKNVPLTDKVVLKTFKSKDIKPEVNTEIKNEHLKEEEKNVEVETQNLKHFQDNSTIVESREGVSNVKNVPSKKVFKNKEKVLLKATIHSKHCRKINQRIFPIRIIKVC